MNPLFLLLDKKKKIIFRSMGSSMVPVLFPGDKICISKVKLKNIKINDILAININDQLVIHRLTYINLKKNKIDWVITKGDNNQKSDGVIRPSQILGTLKYRLVKNKISYPDNIYLIQSTLYFKELTKLCLSFNDEKLNYVILKGLPLHLFYEKKIPRKLYADCDILISSSNYTQCVKLISSLGYKPVDNAYVPDENKSITLTKEVSYYKIVNNFPIVIDIHLEPVFGLTQLSSTEFFYSKKLMKALSQEMLQDIRHIKVEGIDFPILKEKILLPYLLLHLFHHNFQGIHRLQFISQVLTHISHDVKKSEILTNILNNISVYKLNNYVWGGLWLLKKYYSTEQVDYLFNKVNPSKYIQLTTLFFIQKLSVFNDPSSRTADGIVRFIVVFLFSSNNIFIKLGFFVKRETRNIVYHATKNILTLKKNNLSHKP